MEENWREKSDAELLGGWFGGEAQAFDAFFERHAGRVLAYARKKGLGIDAEDVVQLVFMRLHRDIDHFDPSRPALPWFFTIVHRTCIDALRRRGREVARESLDADMPSLTSAPQVGADELGETLRAGLQALKPEQRDLVRMRVDQELSFREISAATGKTEVSLRKAFERAIAFLRAHMGKGDEA